MNERIQQLAEQAGEYVNAVYTPPVRSKTPGKIWEDGHIGWNEQFKEKFAELIVAECSALNKKQGYNLSGVVIDTEHSSEGFDQVCLNTVKHVEAYLFSNTFEKHFGVEE